jgi:hypothetical protein
LLLRHPFSGVRLTAKNLEILENPDSRNSDKLKAAQLIGNWVEMQKIQENRHENEKSLPVNNRADREREIDCLIEHRNILLHHKRKLESQKS